LKEFLEAPTKNDCRVLSFLLRPTTTCTIPVTELTLQHLFEFGMAQDFIPGYYIKRFQKPRTTAECLAFSCDLLLLVPVTELTLQHLFEFGMAQDFIPGYYIKRRHQPSKHDCRVLSFLLRPTTTCTGNRAHPPTPI
jgi:hypothetical protein